MHIHDLMTAKPITLSPDESMHLADVAMKWRHIRHLPVVDHNGNLVGLITHRDILRHSISSLANISPKQRAEINQTIPVKEIMTTDLLTCEPHMPVIQAAESMRQSKKGCLLVTEGDKLLGIVTEADFVKLIWNPTFEVENNVIVSLALRNKLKVKDLMSKDPDTLRVGTLVGVAMELMQWAHYRHVPVVNDRGDIAGIITHRDILRSLSAPKPRRQGDDEAYYIAVDECMQTDVLVTTPDTPLKDAAKLILENKIGCLPVIEDRKLAGIITESDFLKLVEIAAE